MYRRVLVAVFSLFLLNIFTAPVFAQDWQEVTENRNRTSKTYQDADSPKKFTWEGSLAPVHYESVIGSGNYDTEIDTTPVRVQNKDLDGYEITRNGWHYRLGNPSDKGEDGWVGFGGRKGEKWFNFRLQSVGYLGWNDKKFDDIGGNITYDRKNLTTKVNTLIFGPNNEKLPVESVLSWNNLWTTENGGTLNIRWRVNGDELKEEIVIDQKARDYIKTSKAPKTKKDETYFGFIFKIDWENIPKIKRDGVEKSKGASLDLVDDGKPIELKDEMDRLLAFMPISDAWVNDENGLEIKDSRVELKKRFYKQGNETYLMVGLSAETLDSLPDGDLVIDPTVDAPVGAGTDDYCDPSNADFHSDGAAVPLGHSGSASWRSGIRFPGVILPDGVTISNSYITFTSYGAYANNTCSLLVYGNDIADAVAPTSTVQWNALTWTTATVAWSSLPAWTKDVAYNSADLSSIIGELVASYDYSGGAAMQFKFLNNGSVMAVRYGYSYDGSAAKAPNLHIEYAAANSAPSSPTSATQLKNDASTSIGNSGYTNETNVKLRASATDSDTTETLTLFFEAVGIGNTFTSTATPTTGGSCASGTNFADCVSKIWYVTSDSGDYSSSAYTGTVNVAGLSDANGYKWQVKACDDTPACSSWVAFNATTPNFTVDTSGPTGPTNLSSSDHSLSTWSEDDTISVGWTAAEDVGIGLSGYSYIFDTTSNTTPDTTQEIGGLVTVTSSSLDDGNAHYFHLRAVDSLGNWGTAAHLGPYYIDTTSPSAPGPPSTTSPTADSTPTWTWTASTDGGVGLGAGSPYTVQWCGNSGFGSCSTNTATTNTNSYTHSTALPEGTWYFRVKAKDSLNNESDYSSNGSVVIDTTGPTVSSVSSGSPDSTEVTISWTTSEDSSSKVDYGLTNSYGTSTSETDTSTRVQSHSVSLSDLISCTTYHYRVRSKDGILNESIGSDNTFTTTGCAGSAKVDSQATEQINSNSGGTIELLEDEKGITLTIPEDFSNTNAVFQIKQLDKTETVTTTSTPTGYSTVGSYIYDLKALSNVSTSITTFDTALTIKLAYAASDIVGIEESSLKIYRWNGSSWNALSGCTVDISAKNISCNTTAFSVFGLFGQMSSTGSSADSSSVTTPLNQPPSCGNIAPGPKAPWLYGAIAQDNNSIVLYFTPSNGSVDKYVLEYGTSSGNYQYGVQDLGVNSKDQMTYLVSSLSSSTSYYFRLRAGNGCATGPWSNEISSTTKGNVSLNQLQIVQSELEPNETTEEPAVSIMPTPSLGTPTPTPLLKSYDVKVKVIDTEQNPVKGAKVTIHSKVQEAITDQEGVAEFKNVEEGEHKVLIASDGYKGEQSINLTGEVKKFDLNITVKSQTVLLTPLVIGIISGLILIIIILIFLLARSRRSTV